MEVFEILLPIGLILLLSKLLGIGAKHIGLPAVIGMLITGLLIGAVQYIPGVSANGSGFGQFIYGAFFSAEMKEVYSILAKIGVVLIMFSAGLGTDIKKIKATGAAAMIITTLGVVVPMFLGFGLAFAFDYFTDISLLSSGEGAAGEVNIISDLFYGAILTATSVSITVATLKELNKLDTNVGTAIVSAAVIDDILGIIVLSVLSGLDGSGGEGEVSWFNPNAGLVILKIFLFFVAAVAIGLLMRKLFRWLEARYPHHRRIPIFSLALAFLYAYAAEKLFGVADITGAYLAGIVLCGMHDSLYDEQKADSLGYLIFTPIFFANIGISSFSFGAFSGLWLMFGLLYVLAGLLGKFIGCGAGGLICRFSPSDSAKIGAGMMVRAEVILVCAQTGINLGIVSGNISTYVCLIIIISSLTVPVFLKALYGRDEKKLLEKEKISDELS